MAQPSPPPIPFPPHISSLLASLHKKSLDEEESFKQPGGVYEQMRPLFQTDMQQAQARLTDIMRDKFIALDQDKAQFVSHLIRATGATNVIEAGTSFGVSTIYLGFVVGLNAREKGLKKGEARVIATEHEATKAKVARENWKEAGKEVEEWVELREGDIMETLKKDVGVVDFVLLDIWTPMVLPIVKLIQPHFRAGTVLIADNTIRAADGYKDFFEYINAPGSGFTTLTLPYTDGLEMILYRPTS